MSSAAFKQALEATGYLTRQGVAAEGLIRRDDAEAMRLRAVMRDPTVGLLADATFNTRSHPIAIFKDAGDHAPDENQIRLWHEAAWNVGLAPLLWIITPTDVRLYDCFASPGDGLGGAAKPLGEFSLVDPASLRSLDEMCGRLATETGAFWASRIGEKIDRSHRVDRQLLAEISALEDQLTALPPVAGSAYANPVQERAAANAFAQRLIGRCIFTWYLLDRDIAQPFLPAELPADMGQLFATPQRAFALFEWLRRTFNGDLFPMDDPGAERTRLGPQHLALIQEFIAGRSLVSGSQGQGRLFRFRFNAIPVDLISSIYQQFARASAADESRSQGLHYTPVELVHLTLDPVFEGLAPSGRVIDPTCGSGAFLVESFRRLVWRNCADKPASRSMVRNILYTQLFGIDVNRSALGIAAFSLYLAALEFDEEPVGDIADLKFDRLIGRTLFEADTIGGELPEAITASSFDAVIGNPPWTFDSAKKAKPRKANTGETRPRRSPDQAFLHVAADLAGPNGRIGMVIKATPLFSRDSHAIAARDAILRRLRPAAVVNLSALRKEGLFPDADGPALLFFARCTLMPRADQLLVGSIPWSADFARSGVFSVGVGDLRAVPLERVLSSPPLLKAATFGTLRDCWFVERLERDFPTLQAVLDGAGATVRGQGYQVKGAANAPPSYFFRLPALTPREYTSFRVRPSALKLFDHETLHRVRDEAIYKGPLLLCPKASFKVSPQLGRYTTTFSEQDVVFSESFYGVSFANGDPRIGRLLNAILSSSIATFQLAFAGGAWGLERSTVEPNDLLSLRVPAIGDLESAEVSAVLQAEAALSTTPSLDNLERLDTAVYALYDLEVDEIVLARESIARARSLIFESPPQRLPATLAPDAGLLEAYAQSVIGVVDRFLRTRGARHMQASIYDRPLFSAAWQDGSAGLTAMCFRMADGPPSETAAVETGAADDLARLADWVRGDALPGAAPPYLSERRQLRLYLQNDLFLIKPSERRYWSQTAGLNDADLILADHWLRSPHVAQL